MRYFNTSGPCQPEKHYTILREDLIAKGQTMVAQGRYFTIFAPRQAGKTTYFQLLLRAIEAEQTYTPLWISFENLKTAIREEFYEDLTLQLRQYLGKYGISVDQEITNQIQLAKFFSVMRVQMRRLVLVIDEFEGIPDCVLSEIMHTFRKLYHQREFHGLQSVILVGVSTLAELVVSSASPFNVVDDIQIPYFSPIDVHDLIQQYVEEAGQPFEPAVVQAIYDNTRGQPGLVCALCAYLVEQVATDRQQPVTMPALYLALKHFTTERIDKNISNVVQKARLQRDLMLRLLFTDTPREFNVNDPDLAFLYAHGVIGNVNGYVEIAVPLYRKVLIAAFRPLINGEANEYFDAHDTFKPYLHPEGLNLRAILLKYRDYIRRRGFKAFDTEHLKEGAWHYSLDGFINFFVEQIGGDTFIETPTSRGRIDLLILYRRAKYIIETKIFTTAYYVQKGKRQLAEYLSSEGLAEGYYVVFSNKHTERDQLDFDETVNGKRIYTSIICTRFDRATEVSAAEPS